MAAVKTVRAGKMMILCGLSLIWGGCNALLGNGVPGSGEDQGGAGADSFGGEGPSIGGSGAADGGSAAGGRASGGRNSGGAGEAGGAAPSGGAPSGGSVSSGGAPSSGGGASVGGSATGGGASTGGSAGETVVRIYSGGAMNCAQRSDGQVKCWGANESWQLGWEGDSVSNPNAGDGPDEMGGNLPLLQLPPGSIEEICMGEDFACARTDAGGLSCWGNNDGGRLARGVYSEAIAADGELSDMGPNVAVVDIACGAEFACAVLEPGGEVKCWGRFEQGQLGNGATNYVGDEASDMGKNMKAALLPGPARHVAAGGEHACAILEDDSVRCWGKNALGQLGLGDTANRGLLVSDMANLPPVPLAGTPARLALGANHSCALLTDGRISCWGNNYGGQLGLGNNVNLGDDPNEVTEPLPTLAFDPTLSVIDLVAHGDHNCALFEDGGIRCWGANYAGELGYGDTVWRGSSPDTAGENLPWVNLGNWEAAVGLSTGGAHTCAMIAGGAVKCWGDSLFGQLGQGDFLEATVTQVTSPKGLAPVSLW